MYHTILALKISLLVSSIYYLRSLIIPVLSLFYQSMSILFKALIAHISVICDCVTTSVPFGTYSCILSVLYNNVLEIFTLISAESSTI